MTELEALLRRMAEGDVPIPASGVCTNLLLCCRAGAGWVSEFGATFPSDVLKYWPESCGNSTYPIAGIQEYFKPTQLWAGENGEKRKRLCLWLADLLALRDAGL